MSSTGNDIVALHADMIARAAQPRFYSKILTPAEKDLYDAIVADELLMGEYVWLLWSVKEAVYKLLKRLQPTLLFSPPKIEVSQLKLPVAGFAESWRCTVYYGTTTIYTQTCFHSSFLHTVAACQADFTGSHWGTGAVASADYATQSAGCRSLLTKKINSLFPGNSMVLQKTVDGIPGLREEKTGTIIPVSFSHDGIFVGYTLYLQVAAKAIPAY